MKTRMRRMALGLAVLALAVLAGKARATPTGTANLDLQVTFSGSLSVKVDGVQDSTRAVSGAPNTLQAPVSSSTVTNDAAGLTEQWQLSVASTGNWTVAGTTNSAPGLDAYAYQALFISSSTSGGCPATGASDWNSYVSTVTATPTSYLSQMYADAAVVAGGGSGLPDVSSGAGDGDMYVANAGTGAGARGLCVRLYMPGSISTQSAQMIRLTVTAANAK